MTSAAPASRKTSGPPLRIDGEGTSAPGIRSEPIAALDRRYQGLRVASTPGRRASLRASLERHGQQQPVLASSGIEEGRLVLLDGFKRVDLLGEAGEERVWVAVVALDAPSSLTAMAVANVAHRGLSDLEEAWILAALEREHGLDQVEIAERFGRHKSWVCRRLSLESRLERAVQDDVRLGLLSATAARELARLPRGNQVPAANAVSTHGLSSRQASRLVAVLLKADPAGRGEILRDPLVHVQGRHPAMPAPDPRLGEAANRVRERLLRLHGAAGRLDEVVLNERPSSLGASERAVLAGLAAPILAFARAALERLEAEIGPAEEMKHAS